MGRIDCSDSGLINVLPTTTLTLIASALELAASALASCVTLSAASFQGFEVW